MKKNHKSAAEVGKSKLVKEVAVKLSEEMQEKLPFIRLCKNCRILKQDMIIWKKKSCPLCGNPTQRYKFPNVGDKKVDRFPRELDDKSKQEQEIISKIADTCSNLGCPGTVGNVVRGPVVTEYLFQPDRYTRVKRLKTLNEDLALALKADAVSIRRVPKEGQMGISVPNEKRIEVTFDYCFKNVVAHRYDMAIPLNFGITSTGEPYVEDLADYPHLLIGGATGSGKSVLLKQIITSLLAVRTPKELQFVFVDPKTVELFRYKGIPHMFKEMNPESTVWGCLNAMETLIQEVKRRTANLHILKANNIKELNQRIQAEADALKEAGLKSKDGAVRKTLDEQAAKKLAEKWPYVVMVIDEMAEIVLQEKKEFTTRLASIAQMARAAGICVIAATQRPSVDVLKGTIKTNFLARAALRVPSATDSKTILGWKGAETLLGKGDLFLISPDKSGLQRIHVAECKDEHVNRVLQVGLEKGHMNNMPADFMTAEGQIKEEPNQQKAGKTMVN